MKLQSELANLLQLAFSAERAAAFAYQGHAASVSNQDEKIKIKEIEDDEWIHREEVLKIMEDNKVKISKWYEVKYYVIGKCISWSCYVIGWFMPMYFAGRLESGNVNEYFKMKALFNQLNISTYDEILEEMGKKKKNTRFIF